MKSIKILGMIFVSIFLFCVPVFATTYTYDNLGRLISATYDSGQKVTYTYDAAGNLLSAVDPKSIENIEMTAPSTAAVNSAISVTVKAKDVSGNTYESYRGKVHFTSTDSSAVLPADYTFTSTDNGSHTFSVTLKTLGAKSLTVTDTANSKLKATGNITVSALTTSKLEMTAPSTAAANSAISVTVKAKDASGNTYAGYRGKVYFMSTDSSAVLPADYTFTSTDKGSHTFSVTLKTVGAKNLTVTDTVTGTLKATNNITVSALTTSKLEMTAPSTAVANSAISVTVKAKDASGNTYAAYRGKVHFTSTDSAAVLPADYTFTSTDNGSHTFSVTLKTAGAKSVTVNDTVTSTLKATSNITVNPGAVAKLAMTAPSTATANSVISITVKAQDASGNTATGYRGKVHFTSTDSSAVLPADYTFTSTDNGSHTFSVTLKTAGAKSVTVNDTVTSTLKATSNVTVSAAVAAKLATTAPSTATANSAITVTVKIQDASGNTVTGYRGKVHFTSTDSSAVLPADYTFTSTDSGGHTFSVTLKTAGAKSVTVTDTVASTLTATSKITVSAAATSKLEMTA